MTDERPPQPGPQPEAGHTTGSPTGPTGTPPPAGPGPYDPPPLTAFAWRNGLVRPRAGGGRLFVGVCGALGRATNTDPILWRVVIAVLALFGGIGIVLYLLGWMLLPADGDTASPVEAVLGRGRSSTPTVLAIVISVACLLSFGAVFSAPFRPGLLGGALLALAVVLLVRDQRNKARSAPAGYIPAPNPTGPYAMSTDTPTAADAPYPAGPAVYPPPPYPPP